VWTPGSRQAGKPEPSGGWPRLVAELRHAPMSSLPGEFSRPLILQWSRHSLRRSNSPRQGGLVTCPVSKGCHSRP
jgi:hypothetical protein